MIEVINTEKYTKDSIFVLSEIFTQHGYVKLPNFFINSYFDLIKDEVACLSEFKFRRDFVMQEYGSPRHLSVLGGALIKKESSTLLGLYNHNIIRAYLSKLTQTEIHDVNHVEEYMVVNILDGTRELSQIIE